MNSAYPFQVVNLIGIPLSACDRNQLLRAIESTVQDDRKILILSGNVHAFNLAYENQWLKELYWTADIVRLDGQGLRLGAKLLGNQLPRRMTWADFSWDLAAYCAERSLTLYLLGAGHGIAEKASKCLKERNPKLRVLGCHHGYFNKTKGNPENRLVIEGINALAPDILIVGFGMPMQEKWLMENLEDINVNVTLTGGAVFDYLSGELHRAPHWITDNGLEWLGRMIIEPRRLWHRYLIGNPQFIWRILKQRLGLLDEDL